MGALDICIINRSRKMEAYGLLYSLRLQRDLKRPSECHIYSGPQQIMSREYHLNTSS